MNKFYLNPDYKAFCQEVHTNHGAFFNTASPDCLPDEHGNMPSAVLTAVATTERALRNEAGTQWLNLQGPGISSEYGKCPPITELVYGWMQRTYPRPSKWERQPLLYAVDQPYALS